MAHAPADRSTHASQLVNAPPEAVWSAFVDPDVLVQWLPPAEMTGKVHEFDGRAGGGYRMSLFYPRTERMMRGKTAEREDRVNVRFVELDPPRRILEAVRFETDDPSLQGEMTIEVTLREAAGGTEVTFHCTDLPPGLLPEHNQAGSRLSLEQLARRFE
jgi:uncharacterized protein YndB with AHSA1/START domain